MWPFKPKVRLDVKTVAIDPLKLRLGEWQADQKLTNAAAKLLMDPTFQLMLQVNRNESPAFMALTLEVSLESRALHQARIEGFNMALRNFEAMGVHQPIHDTELTATFEPEERQ